MRTRSLVLCIGTLGIAAGCASDDTRKHTSAITEDLGSVRMAIAVAPGLDIDSVAYSIQVPQHEALQGTLPVAADGTVRGTVADVPAGEGVVVSLTAGNDDGVTCSGEGTVSVRAGEVVNLSIGLQCRLPPGMPSPTTGSISISGSFNACPKLLAASADPTSTETTSAITANAEDADGDTLSFKWTAGAGAFADAAVASTTYTCGATGEQTLTVTVDDGKGCTHSKAVVITCTAAPAPVCGNGAKEGDEACDDGNTAAGDGCSATCTVEAPAPACGDGTKDDGEACDDGNTAAGDGCSATCTVEAPAPACGDGTKDDGEACDDGNTASGDGCSATCTVEEPPEGDDLPCDVQAVLQAKCQSCHGQPLAGGPMPLITLADLRADSPAPNAGTPVWQRVKVRISDDPGPIGPMPPAWAPTGALSAEEKATLNSWLDDGAKGSTCAAPQ
jgi:cysteine-rich repeat protein